VNGQAEIGYPSTPRFFYIRESRGERIESAEDAVRIVGDEAQADREWLQALYLDQKHQVIEKRLESWGTVDSAGVYPREIVRAALELGAASIVLIHNHPSGDPEPSRSDKDLTLDLVQGAAYLGLRVLDHVVIGARVNGTKAHYSFAEHGLIDDYRSSMRGR